MDKIKYFLQFIIILILFFLFKLLGLKYSTRFSGNLMTILGPMFRSNKIIISNLTKAFPKLSLQEKKNLSKKMWFNYGRILAEYMYIKYFREKEKFSNLITIENQNILEKIKKESKPVIFISGHFNNFELMAMQIDKAGIDLSTIYRPLNNIFLNPLMERIRKKYICKKQIKKGIAGTKELLQNFKNGSSIALMIDQRVTEGIMCDFFGQKARTTTIPAQFVKKFNCKVVPINIERKQNSKFKLTVFNPITFNDNDSIENITHSLNLWLEKIITNNPSKWIWSHDRWK